MSKPTPTPIMEKASAHAHAKTRAAMLRSMTTKLLLILLLCGIGNSAFATDWQTKSDGDPAVTSNWEEVGNSLNSPIVFTSSGDTWTIKNAMTMTGDWSVTGDLAIDAAGSLNGDYHKLILGGSLTNNGSFTTFDQLNFNSGHGGNTISGSFTGGNAVTNIVFSNAIGEWAINSAIDAFSIEINAGTVTGPAGQTISISNNWLNDGNFIHNGSTHNFYGSGTVTLAGSMTGSNAFGNITASATNVLAGNPLDIARNLTITSGSVSMGQPVKIGGDISNSGTFATNVVELNGINQSITGTTTFNDLMLSNSGTKTFNSNITIDLGTLTVASGVTLDMTTNQLLGAGSMLNSGTIRTQNTSSTPLPSGNTWGGTVIYENTSTNQTISNGTYNNLQIGGLSGTRTHSASGVITVNGVLTVTANTTLDMRANQLQGSGTFTNNGIIKTQNTDLTPIPGGTWGGTVNYDASAGGQSVTAGTYNNLVIGGSSGTWSAAGNINLGSSGTLTINSGTTLDMDMNRLLGTPASVSNSGTFRTRYFGAPAYPSDLTWGGTVELYNTSFSQELASGTYNNVSTNTASLAGTTTINGNWSINGPVSVPSITLTLAGTVSGMSASNSFNVNGGLWMINGSGGNLGTLYFDQTSDGTSNRVTSFRMNRTGGSVNLGNKLNTVSLDINAGQIILGNDDLVQRGTLTGGGSVSRCVIANGTGSWIRYSAGGAVLKFLLGDGTNYAPIWLDVAAGGSSSSFVKVRLISSKHPNNNSSTDYLKRYWSVTTSGYSAPSFRPDFVQYNEINDVQGTEGNIKAAVYTGGTWTKYDPLSGGVFTLPAQTATSFDVSGITGSNPAITIANKTICAEQTTTLTASVTGGDAPYTYQWYDPSGSMGTDANQGVSPMATTVYTVIVTDNNTQTAQQTATVTVNQLPVLLNSTPTPICSGIGSSPIILSSTAGGSSAYTWTVTADAQITGATSNCAAACGTSIPQNLTNSNNVDWYNVTYHIITTNTSTGCVGHQFDLTQAVKPKPTVTTSSPAPICSEAGSSPIALTASTTTPATFTWTTSAPGAISGQAATCASSCGTSINQSLVSTNHTVSLTVTYNVTATADGCSSVATPITQTVKPLPQITTTQPASTCSNAGSANISLAATTTIPATFTWVTTADPEISGHSATCVAACGTTIAQTLVNSDNSAAHNVVYVITPTSNGCVGTNSVLTQVVRQHPDVISFSSQSQDACIGTASTASVTASLVDGNYTFNYTLGGANSGTYTSATVAMSGGFGTFTIPANQLPLAGLMSLTINYVTSNSTLCSSSTPSGNVSSFYVIPTPTVIPAVASGFPGTAININGFDFNTTPANNYVYFGATRAVVNSASVSQLNVTIPVDATYAPVTVVNNYCSVMGYSQYQFIPNFDNSPYEPGNINFAARVNFTSGANPMGITMGDMDGDGKTDMIVTSKTNSWVSVYRNMSTSGVINAASFPTRVDFATGTSPVAVIANDFDNDGKLDLAVTSTGSRAVSILRNTSSGTGNIAFAPKVDYTTGFNPLALASRDLNMDGKTEIVVANQSSSTVSVFQNNSTPGSIAFAAKVDFATGDAPSGVAVLDMNGDGKADIVTTNTASTSNSVSVLRNQNNGGAINSGAFAARVNFATSANPQGVAVGDLNGDNLPEVVATNSNSNSISLFRNTSSGGALGFAAKSDLSVGAGVPYSVAMGDLDGDSKTDLVIANQAGYSVSVFRNTSSGSLTFDPRVNFTTGSNPTTVAVGDVDGDGKADIAVSNSGDGTFSILRSNPAVKPISGATTVCQGQTTQLSSGTPGGSWNSATTTVATVDNSGLVSGVTGGTSVISYTVNGATSTLTMTVRALPTAILGLNSVCIGSNILLSNAVSGGTWSSSNTSVATTNTNLGYVFGVAPGEAVITYATSCGSVTTTITATPGPSAIVGIAPVCPGATVALSNPMTGGTWTSANTSVATVNLNTGVATGVAAGNATIIYTTACGSITATLTTKSLPSAIAGNKSICPGATSNLSNTVSGGVWSSANTEAATIDPATGLVTAVATGTSEITYTTDCSFVTTTVTVRALPSVIAGTTTICANGTTTLSNDVAGGTWTSGTTTVATIGLTSGVVTPTGAGTTVITYRTACANETTIVTVNALPSAISGATTVCQGATTTLSNTVAGGSWTSATTTVATIDETTGMVTALAPGTSVMTYVTECGAATATVTVGALPSVIAGNTTICANGTTTLSNDLAGGTWTSGTTTVATIGLINGVVTPIGAGTTLITYRTSCGNATAMVTVNALPAAITGTMAICPAGSTTLSNAVAGGTWTSSNTDAATIDENTGEVTGAIPGTTLITYATECGSRTATLTVTTPPGSITGITDICQSGSTTLSNAVTGGTWTSGTTTVAIINMNTGVVTPVAPGTTEITYATACGSTFTNVVVNPAPSAIAGASSMCPTGPGSTTTLSNSVAGGAWTSSNTTIATVDPSAGVVTAVASGNFTISYTTECGIATKTMTVGPLPASITGVTSMCNSGTVTLSNAISGGSWFSSITGVANIGMFSGVVTPTAPGTTVISYVLSCGSTSMSLTVNPAPSAISGNTSICPSSTTTLSNSVAGGVWSSNNSSVATVSPSTGVVSSASTPGNVTIFYTTACGSANTSVTVRTTPAAITGVRGMCTGSSTTLSSTTPGGTWSSDNTPVADVDLNTGVVTSTGGAGTANISYNTDCGSTSISVTVSPTPATIAGASSVDVPNTIQLSNAVSPGTWSSEITRLATVTASGVVTGVSSGTAIISYSTGTGCATTKNIDINVACVGLQATLDNGGIPGGTWTSSNSTVATVALNTGVASYRAAGTVVMTYRTSSTTATTTITVQPLSQTTATGSTTVCQGLTISLANATVGTGTWSSSNTNVATVSASGLVVGYGAGTATILYTTNKGCVAMKTVTITPSATISGGPGICQGQTINVSSSTAGGTWSSSNASIASVVSSGVIKGIGAGTARITYMLSGGCASSVSVTVSALGTSDGLTSVCQGQYVPWTNNTIGGGGVWSSSNNSIATVTAAGQVWGAGAGTANILYTLGGGCTATRSVTVKPGATISGTTTACVGSTTQLSNSISGGNWYSSSDALATVSAAGLVRGVYAGSPRISYILPTGCASTVTITVNPLNQTTGGTSGMCASGSMTLANNTAGGGVWSSSNTSRATVNPSTGVVRGVGAGTVNILFTTGLGCVATRTVTVNACREDNTTSIAETAQEDNIRLFPNPNKGQFTLAGTFAAITDGEVHIEVVNMLGQVIYRNTIQVQNGSFNHPVQLQGNLANGMYLLNLRTDSGTKLFHFMVGQ